MATLPSSPHNTGSIPTRNTTVVWQWNCRSFRNKKTSLLPFAQQHFPDIIALQEVDVNQVTLRDYNAFYTTPQARTAILVRNTKTAQLHALSTTIDHAFVELLPSHQKHPILYILNIYSPPSGQLPGINSLIKQATRQAKGNQLAIVGDFNAPHTAWGYARNTRKGTQLQEAIQQNCLSLCNQPHTPTRIGNSVSRDTSPDLTLTRNIAVSTWRCLAETLGSDHYIIELQIPNRSCTKQRLGTARLTDWKKFREETPDDPIQNLETWTKELLGILKKHTRELPLTQEYPAVDTHLQHLWDARNGLIKRWKKRKTNRKLKLRISKLTKEAEEYADQISRQNWTQFCDRLQGTLGTRKTWHLLRSLMGTRETKTAINHQIRRLIHNYPGTEQDLLNELKTLLEATTTHNIPVHPSYTGQPNQELDAPFTIQEIEAVIRNLTRNTAPGRDQIPNKVLRNLDPLTLDQLLDYINTQWTTGTLPPQWKHADVTLIPKPGKPLSLKNLRPISLTSCVGKLLEHLVHNRLSPYIENNDYFPPQCTDSDRTYPHRTFCCD